MATSASADIEYWEQQIRLRFQRYDADFIGDFGDIGDTEKVRLPGSRRPFGLPRRLFRQSRTVQ
jgi:hypothetical protein